MYLALRDLRFARGRFALMGAVVVFIAVLGVLLTGLAAGLGDSGVSALRALPAGHLAFADGVTGELFSRSTVTQRQWEQWADRPGVRAAEPFGDTLVQATLDRDGKQLDLAVFGVRPGSFLAPHPDAGSPLSDGSPGILISKGVQDQGVRVGDQITAAQSGVKLPVVGTIGDRSFGHVAVVYAPLATWQRLHYGLPGELPPAARQQATAVALAMRSGSPPAHAYGTHTVGRTASYAASPGYTAESSTMNLIRIFLYVISALVVGAFFTVWTVQRRAEIALLKAMGASTRYILTDALAQAATVLLLATAAGTVIGLAVGRLLTGSAPFSLRPAPVLTASAALILVGLLGAAAAVRRITSIDPLTALGADR